MRCLEHVVFEGFGGLESGVDIWCTSGCGVDNLPAKGGGACGELTATRRASLIRQIGRCFRNGFGFERIGA